LLFQYHYKNSTLTTLSSSPYKKKVAITMALHTVLFVLLCMCIYPPSLYAQRVYANAQQYDNTFLTCSVTNPGRAADGDYSNFSILGTVVAGFAWQNLQFTGANKPISTTPIIVKATTSLSLLAGTRVQPTNNTVLVGSPLTYVNNETNYGAPNVTYDGVRLYMTGVLGSINLYYALFIVAPQVNNIAICTGYPAVLTIQNYQAGYSYKLYENLTEIATTLNTTTHTLTTTGNLTSSKNYHVVAFENGTNYPSGRTPVTVTVNPNPLTPNTSLQ
jgi:hypothetical protein